MNEGLVLCIETATEVCSVALSKNGVVLALEEEEVTRDHAKLLTSMIQRVMAAAKIPLKQIQAIAVSAGPGSYTGLRVGVSTAKGLGLGLGVPLIAIDTLEALALAAIQQQGGVPALYAAMIDARRMEVYLGVFDHSGNRLQKDQAFILDDPAANAIFQGAPLLLAGNGAPKALKPLMHYNAMDSGIRCSAIHLAVPAATAFAKQKFVDSSSFEPNYLKNPNITTPRNPWASTS